MIIVQTTIESLKNITLIIKIVTLIKDKASDGHIDHNEAKEIANELIDGLDSIKDQIDEYQYNNNNNNNKDKAE